MTKQLARNDFDAVSPVYDALAQLVFGGAIRRSQIELLPEVSAVESVLIIGGGTGWFLYELLARTKARRVVYLELSKDMLDKSRKLIERKAPQWLDRVEFRLGTQDSLTAADGKFDVIATNFFLACFGDDSCSRVISSLHPFLARDGRWLFVDFKLPERGWQRAYAQLLFKVMFTFFNVFSGLEARRPPNYELGFRQLGLRLLTEQRFYARMIQAKLMTNPPALTA